MFRRLKGLLGMQERPSGELVPATEAGDAIKPYQKRVFGTRDFHLGVAGTTNYGPAIKAAVAGQKQYGDRSYIHVVLETEPENPYDPNAVRVMSLDKATIGYLYRDKAGEYRPAVQHCRIRGSG